MFYAEHVFYAEQRPMKEKIQNYILQTWLILEKDKKLATTMKKFVNYDLGKYQDWYADQVLPQFNRRDLAHDAKLDI